MHLRDETLRALVDNELPAALAQPAREHLSGCPNCQARIEQIAARAERARARFEPLAPGPLEQPGLAHQAHSPQALYARFANPSRLTEKEFKQPMFTRRPLWTALAIIAVLVLVFTLTPASAWASSLLGLFRVQQVQVVTFDPAAAQQAQDRLSANQAAFEQIFKNDLKIDRHGQEVQVASPEEAAQKAGFTPRLAGEMKGAKLTVQPGMNAVFTIDQPKLQELIDAVGADVKLAPDLNGKVITVDVAEAVSASSGCANTPTTGDPDMPSKSSLSADCTVLVQIPSPQVNAPAGLDVPQMGKAMFQFLGMPADQADALAQRIDWTSTLVIPLPEQGSVQYQDVQVDGVAGTLIQEHGNRYELIWVKNGMLYGLSGPGGSQEALKIAGSIQ